jgi:hypothetical protein
MKALQNEADSKATLEETWLGLYEEGEEQGDQDAANGREDRYTLAKETLKFHPQRPYWEGYIKGYKDFKGGIMKEENSFKGKQGIELTYRNYKCTVCNGDDHGIYIPVDDVEGYDHCIMGLMKDDVCPAGAGQECSVADDDGGGCGGVVENLEDYTEIEGEYIPMFTCDHHQGYFIS